MFLASRTRSRRVVTIIMIVGMANMLIFFAAIEWLGGSACRIEDGRYFLCNGDEMHETGAVVYYLSWTHFVFTVISFLGASVGGLMLFVVPLRRVFFTNIPLDKI